MKLKISKESVHAINYTFQKCLLSTCIEYTTGHNDMSAIVFILYTIESHLVHVLLQ